MEVLTNFLIKELSLKGQGPAHKYIDRLLKHVANADGKLDDIITHRLPLNDIAHGYEIFHKKEDECLKVASDPWS